MNRSVMLLEQLTSYYESLDSTDKVNFEPHLQEIKKYVVHCETIKEHFFKDRAKLSKYEDFLSANNLEIVNDVN